SALSAPKHDGLLTVAVAGVPPALRASATLVVPAQMVSRSAVWGGAVRVTCSAPQQKLRASPLTWVLKETRADGGTTLACRGLSAVRTVLATKSEWASQPFAGTPSRSYQPATQPFPLVWGAGGAEVPPDAPTASTATAAVAA